MSDFDYYYHSVDKARGSEVLDALRQSDDKTKAEAIDYLIDRGYLHSEEIYNSAYVNALGDYLGLSDYDPDDWDEYNAPVGRGTKHSALDEVHQRLREAGKKRRQQRIAQARRMKERKFEGHHGHYHATETIFSAPTSNTPANYIFNRDNELENEIGEIRSQIRNYEKDVVYFRDQLWSLQAKIDHEENEPDELKELKEVIEDRERILSELEELIENSREKLSPLIEQRNQLNEVNFGAEMEMTPDIMDYPGLPVVPDSYGTNSALDSGNGVPQWYGSAETFEAPFAGAGSLFKFGGNDSALGGFTAKELTESSAIHGDFDHASLNYSGHQNIEARAEGDGEVSERVYIRFSWETPSEYDRIIDEYTITDNVYDEVYQEVQSGNYSGVGSWTYYYDQEDDEGNTEESELEVEYQWG